MKRRVSAECLRSVQGFADEMVVVDTGSTDATVAIAEAAGARVEQIPWPGDFAPARNQALEFLNGDWVLVLDADEQLRPEAIPQLLKALMAQPDVLVINLLRHEVGAAMAPYSSVSRLFRRHPSIRWSRPYHSMIDDSVRTAGRRTPMAHRRLQCSRQSSMTAIDRNCWRAATRPIGCGRPWRAICRSVPVIPTPAPSSVGC